MGISPYSALDEFCRYELLECVRSKLHYRPSDTVRSLMRHANISVTMDKYVQAVTPAKRLAQRRVAGLLDPNRPTLLKSNTASC
jgi:hypothetical protein